MTLFLMLSSFVGGCVAWQYVGTKAMTWFRGEFAVINDLRMKATVLENQIRAKI